MKEIKEELINAITAMVIENWNGDEVDGNPLYFFTVDNVEIYAMYEYDVQVLTFCPTKMTYDDFFKAYDMEEWSISDVVDDILEEWKEYKAWRAA